jgi:hypothetical protein
MLKIATQRSSTAAGVGISGSSDLRKGRGLRSGGAVSMRSKRHGNEYGADLA